MILYIKEDINKTKLNEIKSAMELAQQEYPDVGYCFERAEYIRKFLGYGEVMTSLQQVYLINTLNIFKQLLC